MATKTDRLGVCPRHGEFHMDAPDSPCPSCEDATSHVTCPTCGAIHNLTVEDAEDDVICHACGDDIGICRTCESGYRTGGDGYDGECPSCADHAEALRLAREAEEELFESIQPGTWTIGSTSEEDEVCIRVEDEKDKDYLAALFPFQKQSESRLWMKVLSYLEDGKTQVSYEINQLRDLWYGEGGPDVAEGKRVREVSQELAETLGLCDSNGVVRGTSLGEDRKAVLPLEKDASGVKD